MYAVSTSVTFDLAKVTKCIGGEKTTTHKNKSNLENETKPKQIIV